MSDFATHVARQMPVQAITNQAMAALTSCALRVHSHNVLPSEIIAFATRGQTIIPESMFLPC